MPTVEEFAILADEIYKLAGGVPPPGWEIIDYAQPTRKWGFCVGLYRNEEKKELVICFRGTDEVITQVGNAVFGVAGHEHPMAGRAEEYTKDVKERYTNEALIKQAQAYIDEATEVEAHEATATASAMPTVPFSAAGLSVAASVIMPPETFRLFHTLLSLVRSIATLQTTGIGEGLHALTATLFGVRSRYADTVGKRLREHTSMMSAMLDDLKARTPSYKIYLTGHSLGANLAELCAARFDIEAVTFESPGCKELLDASPEYHRPVYDNITTYLAAPNIVNTAYAHVGTVHRVFIEFVEGGWTWGHAGTSVAASCARLLAYAGGIATVASGGAAAPVAAGAGGIAASVTGAITAVDIFGLTTNNATFLAQHNMTNMRKFIGNVAKPPIQMARWPYGAEIKWAALKSALKALLPLQASVPGIRTMLWQNSMLEEQVKALPGYLERTE